MPDDQYDPHYGVPQYGRSFEVPKHPADQQRLDPLWHVPDPTPDAPKPTIPAFEPNWSRGPVTGGVPSSAWAPGDDFLLNLIFVGVLWEVWICLYPLSAFAGLLTLVYAMPFLRGVLPSAPIIGPGLYAVVLGFVAAAIALWNVSRMEQVLARHQIYRVLRHLIRLPLLGIATVVAIETAYGLPYDTTLGGIRRIIDIPVNLAIVAGVMIGSHFILWNWTAGRRFWHARLTSARLRRRGD